MEITGMDTLTFITLALFLMGVDLVTFTATTIDAVKSQKYPTWLRVYTVQRIINLTCAGVCVGLWFNPMFDGEWSNPKSALIGGLLGCIISSLRIKSAQVNWKKTACRKAMVIYGSEPF